MSAKMRMILVIKGRPLDSEFFAFIGATYIDKYMDGKMLDAIERNGVSKQKIYLIYGGDFNGLWAHYFNRKISELSFYLFISIYLE